MITERDKMYKDMVWLAEMAEGFREAANVIDEIIEIKMTINVSGNTTKKDARRLAELMEKYEKILKREKEW